MNTLESAVETITTWIENGCNESCTVSIDPIPDTPTWVDDIITILAGKFTKLKEMSIQYHGTAHTFEIKGTLAD
jgi:hypothetical protein